MLYLSKGVLCKDSTTDTVRVAHGDAVFVLTKSESEIWLNGRFNIVSVTDDKKVNAVISLYEKGLAEFDELSDVFGQYRLLSRCICCPAKSAFIKAPLLKTEKTVMLWLDNAGIRLSTAELIYLMENKVRPSGNLFGDENAQALIETIYTKDTIFDNILENRMEYAKCRNEIVCAILTLLKKKRIVML